MNHRCPPWRLLEFAFFACVVATVGTCRPLSAADFFVAPNGSDSDPGTASQPFATLGRARDAVRKVIAKGMKTDLLVSIQGGTYQLDQTLEFGPQDSGTGQHSVTYSAAEGERVILSGGRSVTDWKPGAGGLWTAKLPDVRDGKWWFRQLYADGKRLERGRYPQKGFLKIKSHSSDYKQLQLESWTDEKGVLLKVDLGDADTEVVVVEDWSISREIIVRSKSHSLTTRTPIGWVGHERCVPKPGMSVFLEHALAFVKQPGQWYLDRKGGVLHYMAAPAENPNESRFVAPVLEQLVLIKGTADHPVRNLHFRNLKFAHTAWKMPKIGYAGIQACYHGTNADEPVTFAVPVAIELSHSHDCSLTDCGLRQIGGSGIGLGAGCVSNHIVGCELADIGGNGVNIGYMAIKDPLWVDWANATDTPKDNEVSSCYLQHCGAELWGAVGIFNAMTSGSRIVHNELSQLPYTGISTGFIWVGETTSQENSLIAYNRIYEVLQRVYDGGGIYTLGYQPGSVIRSNLIYAVERSDYAFGEAGNNGIFFDQASRGFTIEENIIYDTADNAIRFNQCTHEDQTWRDNVEGVKPGESGYPLAKAERTGPLEPYKKRVLTSPEE